MSKVIRERNASKPGRPPSEEVRKRNEVLFAAIDRGLSIKDAASEAGILLSTALGIVQCSGRSTSNLFSHQRVDREAVADDLRRGMTTAEACKKHLTSRETIRHIRDEFGIPNQRIATQQRNAQIVQDVRDGMRNCDIAKKYGIGVKTVQEILSENGLRSNRKINPRSTVIRIIGLLLKGDRTYPEIAEIVGCGAQRVANVAMEARKAEIDIPPSPHAKKMGAVSKYAPGENVRSVG